MKAKHRFSFFLLLLGLLSSSSPVLAQGCVMCKNALSAQLVEVIRAFNLGILVLIFPPVFIMSAILYIAFWRRD